jgi:hypothetical protein
MNDQHRTSPDGEVPQIPDHLHQLLAEAAECELELAADGAWPHATDAWHDTHLERVLAAARVIERWRAGTCTREDIAKLARRAVDEQEPDRRPRTLEEADDVVNASTLTRDLVLLRDALGGRPTQEELDEPG